MPEHWHRNGDVLQRFKVQQGHVVREDRQPSRVPILNQNAALQREPEALRDLDWSQWALSIPQEDYQRLIKKYPELNSPNGETAHRAWKKFLASSESDPYRVRARSRARQ